MSATLREVFSNRNIAAISSTNMIYQIFNGLWELWWSLYLIEELNTPVTIVGLLAMIQSTSSILFQLPGGMLADRIGRKKVIVYGTAMRAIAPIFMFTATTWHWVIPGIVINSMASLYSPAFNAIIAESLPQGKRGTAFGAYRFITSIPAIFMPVVSGFYLETMGIGRGVRVGLMLFTVAAAVAAIVRQIVLKETLRSDPGDDLKVSHNRWSLFESFRRQPKTIKAMLVVAIVSGFATTMTWSFLAPYAYNVVGLSTTQYGLLQSVAMGISVPLYLVSGIIADKYGRVPCILISRALGPFDSLSLLLFRDFNHLLAAYGVIGVAQGLGGGRIRTGGNIGDPAWQALIADLVPSKDRGKVMGFMGTVSGLLSLPGSAIGGYVYSFNPGLVLLVGSILEALQVPIVLFFVKDVKDRQA